MIIRNYDGTEHYKGLKTGFRQWAFLFLKAVEMTKLAYGYQWIAGVKVKKLQ